MALQPGDRFGRYELAELLGKGGMGEVYLARDTLLHRRVALKLLHPATPGSSEAPSTRDGAARILREARAAAAIEHPNAIAIYDVGEVDGVPFLAMEFVAGKTLRNRIGDGTVSLARRVRWLVDIARALGAAHAIGVVHRDIKPENVMVRDDGVVKVLDFGIARRSAGQLDAGALAGAATMGTVTGQGVVVGTPVYMAPEQMRGEPLDSRADQFAWAVLAYELLTGVLPWDRDAGGLQLVSQILSGEPMAPRARNAEVPAAVDGAIRVALSKATINRFARMEDVAEALEPYAAASGAATGTRSSLPAPPVAAFAPTEAAPSVRSDPSTPTQLAAPSPRARRMRWGTGTVAGGVALVVALGVGSWGLRRASRDTPAARAPAVAGCASNAECTTARGKPSVCHHDDGTCAALESSECQVHADARALAGEDTVWLGAMFPLSGADGANYGIREAEAVDLGRRDFAQILGDVGESSAGHVRPIGLVTCDDAVDATRAALHLVDDVRAPAVIGFRTSEELLHLAPSVFLPRKILTVAAVNASPMITTIPEAPGEPRLVWRTMFSTTQFARPLAALVAGVLEPRVRAEQGAARRPAPVRVAFVRAKTLSELALSGALMGALTFNGTTALRNGSSFLEVVVDGASASAPGARPDDAAAIASLLAFLPDIIVYDSADALTKAVFLPLEQRWPEGAPRPLYAGALAMSPDLFPFLGRSASRRRRFFGLTNVSTTTANARLVTHFNETFAEKVTRTASPNGSYDAFYMLGYAVVALGDEPVTGTSLSRAIGRLMPPGKEVAVGPLEILNGLSALRAGGNIDLDGTIGRLDFDLTTGEAPVDMAVLCVGVDRTGLATEAIESGMVFDAHADKLVGDLRCP